MTDTDSAIRRRLSIALEHAVAEGVIPGGVCMISRSGSPTITATAGHTASFDATGQPIDADASELVTGVRQPVTDATVYDLASVSKLYTSITLLSLADKGLVDLDVSVSEWLPAYRQGEKSAVTLAHLLSHTSGLPPTNPYTLQRSVHGEGTGHVSWVPPSRDAFLEDILTLPLAHPVGTDKVYSCLGYITSMAVAEAATGRPWAQLVRQHVLEPLHLTRTTFTPDKAHTAPTEHQPHFGRGMVHGIVHDETASALGGAAGNAGLFAPAHDVTMLGTALLNGLPGVLSTQSFERLWNDQLPGLLGGTAGRVEQEIGYGQSLGLRIGQTSWMSDAGRHARGHTGFTGTSLLIDRDKELVVVLLTNRVHPTRDGADVTALRHSISTIAYEAPDH
ncbi:serine hydrolase domain-containing protein [Microbacterium sp. A84]|uniref:serine hydrolase domain-containing protein n=1 Tax=Microbacterium sp. A84 TaxID=3450715 RepID=UPI003F43C6CC